MKKNGATTRFLYDGDRIVAEYDGSGNLLRRYVHGDGSDQPLVWYEGSDTSSPKYLYADERGSIVAVADASGTLDAINRYDEYGRPGTGNTGRFGYTGQAWLPELNLWYYKARMYDPRLGRFLQTDPIGYADGMNWYAYVKNDPVNKRDPIGTCGNKGEEPCEVTINGGSRKPRYEFIVRPLEFKFDYSFIGNRDSPTYEGYDNISLGDEVTYCSGSTVGSPDIFHPFGRVNTGKSGGVSTALSDINHLALLNGIQPLNLTLTTREIIDSAFSSIFPTSIGGGWYASKNLWTGYWSLENRGLAFRVQPETLAVQIELPKNTIINSYKNRTTIHETCHYRN